MKILGFDPGYGITGWGLITASGTDLTRNRPVYGIIETAAEQPLHERLLQIQQESRRLLAAHAPDGVVVERLYMQHNRKTAGEVYQARGVLLAAIAESGSALLEFSPNEIKQMIAGHGNAGKAEMTLMVRRLLGIAEEIRPDDAADALAGAIAGVFTLRSNRILDRKAIAERR